MFLSQLLNKKYMQINNASKSFEFPLWMLEFVQGPKHQITSWPMYYSRGYHYHTQSHGQNKKTMNFGVCVPGTTETEYFGLIEEIFMIEYHGAVGLKAMIFKCHWFNIDQGIRRHPSGIVDVCPQIMTSTILLYYQNNVIKYVMFLILVYDQEEKNGGQQ